MYLSRLILNPMNNQVRNETNDPYQLHRTVMKGFPDNLPREDGAILFRLEIHSRRYPPLLLVQANHQPNWTWLEGQYDGQERPYLLPDHVRPFDGQPNPAVGEPRLDLKRDQVYFFRLRANPTRKKAKENYKNGRRAALCTEVEQLAWLENKAKQHGFQVLHVTVSGHANHTSWTHEEARTNRLKWFTVQYDGRLQITNAAQFQKALAQGIGPAKAFGCGLLSLAPG